MDQPMDKDCFNMVVRIVACDEIQLFIEPPIHNMDLTFCSTLIDGTRHPKWRKKPGHDISSCNMDGYELRKKFLIHILKSHANEVEDNIPIGGYLRRVKEGWLSEKVMICRSLHFICITLNYVK